MEEGPMETIYEDEGRETLVEDDEMSSEEAAFMKGYEEADQFVEDEEE